MIQQNERLWTTQEIINILAALHSAYDALPKSLRFLLVGWHYELSRAGAAILQMGQSSEIEMPRVWTRQEILGILTMLYGRADRIGKLALSAIYHALYGVMPEPELEQLDPEIWGNKT